jgi:heat shock protein HslJ
MRTPIHPVLLTVMALVAVGCSSPGTAPTPSSPTPAPGPIDATGDWRLVDGRIDGAPIPLVEGTDVTMTVDGSAISGRSACNQYGGQLELVDGTLRFGAMSMTEMACEEPVMALEAAYIAALSHVRSAVRDGTRLTLAGEGVALEFERLAPPPTAAIVGTVWVLDSLISGDAVSSVAGEPATLRLDADGTFAGSTGCRGFGGRWTEANGEILFADFAMDMRGCPTELTGQDDHVVSVLGDGFRATVDGQRLTLTSTGAEGLGYLATQPAS